MKLTVITLSLAALAVACGKESKKRDEAPQAPVVAEKSKLAPPKPRGEVKTQPVVETREEVTPVVVDEVGGETPVVVVPDSGEPATQPVAVEAKTGAGKCTKEPCFSLNDWSLDFGQAIKSTQTANGVDSRQYDGFEHSALTISQKFCLKAAAQALRDFAVANPDAMKPFKEAGISTVFAARLFDTTDVREKVLPSVYFIKGTDGKSAGSSLARGKWIVRSAMTGNKDLDGCLVPTNEQIAKQLEVFKALLIK